MVITWTNNPEWRNLRHYAPARLCNRPREVHAWNRVICNYCKNHGHFAAYCPWKTTNLMHVKQGNTRRRKSERQRLRDKRRIKEFVQRKANEHLSRRATRRPCADVSIQCNISREDDQDIYFDAVNMISPIPQSQCGGSVPCQSKLISDASVQCVPVTFEAAIQTLEKPTRDARVQCVPKSRDSSCQSSSPAVRDVSFQCDLQHMAYENKSLK